MPQVEPFQRDAIRKALGRALSKGGFALNRVPEYTLHLIEVEGWLPDFLSLRELVEAPVLKGGFHDDVDKLVRLCERTPVEVVLREALKGKPGPNSSPSNRRQTQQGTTASYTRSRLERERPDLAERVDAGELTPHKAAIKAGFRKPTASVPVDTPEAAVRALLRRFTRQQILDALGDEP